MVRRRALGPAAGGLAFLLVGASPASATTIDFEALAPSLAGVNAILVPSPFLEDGFSVSTSIGLDLFEGFEAYGTAETGRYTGSAALHNAYCCSNTVLKLSPSGGGLFQLLSIDLSELFQGNDDPVSVSFVGTKQGGGTVTQTVNLDVTPFYPTMKTYAFGAGFSGLESVSWDMANPYFIQFDNIVVSTPEPSSLALLAAALAGAALVRRRRAAQNPA